MKTFGSLLFLSYAISFALCAPTDDMPEPPGSDSSSLASETNEIPESISTVEEPIAVTEPAEVNAVNLQESLRALIDYQINEIVKINDKRKQQGQEIANQVETFLSHVQNLKAKVAELESYLRRLQQEAAPTGPSALPLTAGGQHNAVAVLYRRTNHQGSETTLRFDCERSDECCKNLEQYDNDTQSINTRDTCVEMFTDRDCRGDSRKFYPGSDYSHSDFGSLNDRFSSGKPCYV